MLHLQLRVPADLTEEVVDLLTRDDTVTNVAVFPGGYAKPEGTLVQRAVWARVEHTRHSGAL